jgi:hypothetical protein
VTEDGASGSEPTPEQDASQDTGYTFSQTEALLLVPLVDSAFYDGAGYMDAHERLAAAIEELRAHQDDSEGRAPPADSDTKEALRSPESGGATVGEPAKHEMDRAMMYELVVPFEGPITCRLGRHTGGIWPPEIQCVTEAVADLWEFLAEHVTAPGAKARFHDLALNRGRERFAHAMAARDAYLKFGRSRPVVDLDEGHALLRAWDIDRQFGRNVEEQECRHVIHEALNTAWDAGEHAAGVLLPLLGGLCRTSASAAEDPVPVDLDLERASGLYGTEDSVKYIGELRRSRATSVEERRAIAEWQVGRLASIARSSEGLVKVIRMRDAIDEARRLHLDDLRDALTVELQALPADEVKLESIQTTVPVSRIPYERYFRKFTRDHDWRVGMAGFAQLPPPTGSLDQLKSMAEERRRRPRLADLFRPILLDGDRLPSWQPGSDDEHNEYLIARDAVFVAAVHGNNLAQILDRIHARYGDIPQSELAAFFALEGRGNHELSAVAARALNHYWSGDLEACVHIAVPRIESAARLILKQLDIAIYRTQLGQRPGMYPQLGALLDALEGLDFDEDWAYFLRWLLVNPLGMNLRNEVAHGRVRALSPADAAMVLRALILLVVLAGPGTADDIARDAADPERTTQHGGSDDDLAAKISTPIATPLAYPSSGWMLIDRVVRNLSAKVDALFGRFRP